MLQLLTTAHHPQEIRQTLAARVSPQRLWCVFAHTYTRTRAFLDSLRKLCLLRIGCGWLVSACSPRDQQIPWGFSGCGGPD